MTRIPVEKPHEADAAATSADNESLTDQIRALAYHLFESRGGGDGRDLDNWLDALNSKTGDKIRLGTIDLPEPIDVDRTTARPDHGILYVRAVRESRERDPVAV